MGVRAPKAVVRRLGSGLKLCNRKNRVDSLVIWYCMPIGEASNSLIDPEGADVLLG